MASALPRPHRSPAETFAQDGDCLRRANSRICHVTSVPENCYAGEGMSPMAPKPNRFPH